MQKIAKLKHVRMLAVREIGGGAGIGGKLLPAVVGATLRYAKESKVRAKVIVGEWRRASAGVRLLLVFANCARYCIARMRTRANVRTRSTRKR